MLVMNHHNERQTSPSTSRERTRLTNRGKAVALLGAGVTAIGLGMLLPSNGSAEAAHRQITAEQSADAAGEAQAQQFEAEIRSMVEGLENTGANIINISEVGQGGSAEGAIAGMIPEGAELSDMQNAATVISGEAVNEHFEELHGGALQPTDRIALAQVEDNAGDILYIGVPVDSGEQQ